MQPGFPHDSAAFARAVDLSALKNRAQPSTAPPATPSAGGPDQAPAGAYVVDVTEATFQTEVLERSRSVPVVIDFWASWCAPCRQLSPVLEKLAAEGGGAWALVKIDVDANQRIAAAAAVQSIPSVKAVVDGQIVAEFVGALPESDVRKWINALLQAVGGQARNGQQTEPQIDPRILDADQALQRGDLDAAEAAYRELQRDLPSHPVAMAGLAQVGLLRRVEEVADPQAALAKAEADPTDVPAAARAADVEFLTDQVEQAFSRLIAAVRQTSGDDRETARTHLLSLFHVLPPDDPRVIKARRELATVLF